MCGLDHELVCDLCHYDAHIEARLPVTEELKELSKLADDDDLSPYRDPFLKNLLEEERRLAGGGAEERKDELRRSIGRRESALEDDDGMWQRFERHIDSLTYEERPASERQKSLMYGKWEEEYKTELNGWKEELDDLEDQHIDGRLVFSNATDRLLRLLEAEAIEGGLLPGKRTQDGITDKPSDVTKHVISEEGGLAEAEVVVDAEYTTANETPQVPVKEAPNSSSPASGHGSDLANEWMTFVQLDELFKKEPHKGALLKPCRLQVPSLKTIFVDTWVELLAETAEWLIRRRLLTRDSGTAFTVRSVRRATTRYLIHTEPTHPSGANFSAGRQLSNGLHVECNHGGAAGTPKVCMRLVEAFGQDSTQFRVQLR